MPTIFTHAAVPLMLGAALGRRRIPRRLLMAGAVAAMLPDADVLAFRLGIPYAHDLGHRGATHSIAFALACGLLAMVLHRSLRAPPWLALGFVFLSGLSHALLDALTNGGLGVALYWPFDHRRIFFDWRPIEVSPIGADFFSMRGWHTMTSELQCVWLPAAVLALSATGLRVAWDRYRERKAIAPSMP